MSPLMYLKNELKFSTKEWSGLSSQDKEDLRGWAVEEMTIRGIEIKLPAAK